MPGSLFCMKCGEKLVPEEDEENVFEINEFMAEAADLAEDEGVCRVCGAVNRPDALFCMSCGAELGGEEEEEEFVMPGVCPVCGTVNRPDALFCMACGAELIHYLT